jgi:hypothetical protein
MKAVLARNDWRCHSIESYMRQLRAMAHSLGPSGRQMASSQMNAPLAYTVAEASTPSDAPAGTALYNAIASLTSLSLERNPFDKSALAGTEQNKNRRRQPNYDSAALINRCFGRRTRQRWRHALTFSDFSLRGIHSCPRTFIGQLLDTKRQSPATPLIVFALPRGYEGTLQKPR